MTNYFMSNGGHFTLATGRSIGSAKVYIPHFKLSAPAILLNGAVIYDYNKEKIINITYLDKIWKDYTKKILDKFPNLSIRVTTEDSNYAYGSKHALKALTSIEKLEHAVDNVKDVPDDAANVIFWGSQEDILAAEQYAIASGFDKTIFVKSAPVLLEVVPKNISKGLALKQLANYLDISLENTYAIGDYYNDISMLENAAFSAAVKNAPDDVKAYADITVCSNDDGAVAEFINIIDKRI